ncbi:DJ-1/PfpI family protein [Pasteurella multocida]|uniref:DJ-1/PfpI family protein n=1 Tax=Pasteurella multocida TaxID=747 RepID=UPI000E073D74|nr:DJ-1/PfpI family protein [Pasteurella multocida]MDY0502750.1 DJ-1/PfpI family protein [Pasteurella multocida]MDY0635199.1 DJ-1/PfpI family protein [Pasteurella multocida]MDY0693383.1 DJ-1/PfpI family protein [Pasteurella multocida]SUB39312.1 ThiJ/PfpI family protein [Pasteurella multocida]HDR0636557.1 DJ-1/PfpI family protein [Pasteurella multocida]
MNIYCLLFDDYETLDLMGPIEFLFRLPNVQLHYISKQGGLIKSYQGFKTDTVSITRLPEKSILLIPGGQGTRQLVKDMPFLTWLTQLVDEAEFCLSVCTGSALLAATKQLDGKWATSNKFAFEWVRQINPDVKWKAVARWVRDGKFYSSSGVTAGMDMTLGFIHDHYSQGLAQQIANQTEYIWNADPNKDEFASLYGYSAKSNMTKV